VRSLNDTPRQLPVLDTHICTPQVISALHRCFPMSFTPTLITVIASMLLVTAALTATPSSDLNTQVEPSRDEQEVLWGIAACNTRKQLTE
jgi:hypothetical protein